MTNVGRSLSPGGLSLIAPMIRISIAPDWINEESN